jgi:hypothetical protein
MITFDSFIVGSLLGDGYLPKVSHYDYALYFQHSLKQEEYALYKRELAENLGMKTSTYYIKTNKERYDAIRIRCALEKSTFAKYRHLFYPNGNKTIKRKLLNLLDKDGLSLWWQDDGCLSVSKNKKTGQSSRYGKLCTYSFTKEENEIISRYFKVVWNIETKTTVEKQKYYFQRINATNLNKFFTIINVHESMAYKIDMKYKLPPKGNPSGVIVYSELHI